ncbi:MAG: MBOAT family O-acyltransferase [Sandaracinaceae bacterium]
MLFNSRDFVLFLLLVFAGYWALEPRTNPLVARLLRARPGAQPWIRGAQIALLLAASFLFYMSWNSLFLVLIVASTLVDFLVGLALGRTERQPFRALLLGTSLAANLGLLGLFKYGDFALVATSDVLGLFGLSWDPPLMHLILPVGISFYTFQTLSYTIDVYRRKLEPTDDLLEFATYVAFFPQLVAGPIVRAKEFLPQFDHAPTLSASQAQSGIYLILRGLVKKVAVADFLASALIDRVFDDPGAYSAPEAWVAIFAYTWQLYADFSGYTDIARGSARLFSFELPENFDRPFNTTGPIEFWRRWHMTLSRWVMDYIYIPLGGSRKGEARTYGNLFFSFMVIGVWHGAGWTFVLFGLWHAIGVTANRALRQYLRSIGVGDGPVSHRGLEWVLKLLNLSFYVIHWPIFRGGDLDTMWAVYGRMFGGDWASLRIGPWLWVVIIGMTFLHYCPRRWVRETERFLKELPWPLLGLLVVVVAMLLAHISAQQPTPFIYYQF